MSFSRLICGRSNAAELVAAVREALPELDAEVAVDAGDLEHRCLQALALLDSGHFNEAMASFDPARERGNTHPAARFVAETAERARSAPGSTHVATQMAGLFGEALKLATAALARFVQR